MYRYLVVLYIAPLRQFVVETHGGEVELLTIVEQEVTCIAWYSMYRGESEYSVYRGVHSAYRWRVCVVCIVYSV